MKNKLWYLGGIACLLSAMWITGLSFNRDASGQIWHSEDYEKYNPIFPVQFGHVYTRVASECEICGKTIYSYYEEKGYRINSYYDDMSLRSYDFPIPDSLYSQHIEFAKRIPAVCQLCLQFQKPIIDKLGREWDTYWAVIKKDYALSRRRYDALRKEAKRKALETQIEQLKKQVEAEK